MKTIILFFSMAGSLNLNINMSMASSLGVVAYMFGGIEHHAKYSARRAGMGEQRISVLDWTDARRCPDCNKAKKITVANWA